MIGSGHFLAGAETLFAQVIIRPLPSGRRGIGAGAVLAVFAAVFMAGAGGAMAATTDPEIQDIDKHYEVATKDFGDGTVMMTSRNETGTGPVFTTHQFNCDDHSYSTVFEGDAAPSDFPDPVSAQQTNEFGQDDDVVPLAQHACTKYGRPLMEW